MVNSFTKFKPGGGLDDGLYAGRIVYTGKLHQNLVLPKSVLFNDWFANAQGIHALADGLDALRHGAILQVIKRCRLDRQGVGIFETAAEIVIIKAVTYGVAQLRCAIR